MQIWRDDSPFHQMLAELRRDYPLPEREWFEPDDSIPWIRPFMRWGPKGQFGIKRKKAS